MNYDEYIKDRLYGQQFAALSGTQVHNQFSTLGQNIPRNTNDTYTSNVIAVSSSAVHNSARARSHATAKTIVVNATTTKTIVAKTSDVLISQTSFSAYALLI